MICDLLALRPIWHITQKTLSFPHCTKIEQITKTMVILKQAPLFFAAFAAIQYYHKLPPSGWRILATLPLVVRALWFGQHSLTSVERPSHLRSDFVNVWRHARLVVPPVTHVSFASIVNFDLSDDLMFVSRSCVAFLIIPRLIQPRRCRCICLERMF